MCRFCEHNNPYPDTDSNLDFSEPSSCSSIYISHENGKHYINADNGVIIAEIMYCPRCGRSL